MNSNFSVGSRLKDLRQTRALSQEWLANEAYITPSYLGQVERGVKNITVYTLEKICIALGISLSEFFSVSETRAPHIDKATERILYQVINKSEDEKYALLKLIKIVFAIKEM